MQYITFRSRTWLSVPAATTSPYLRETAFRRPMVSSHPVQAVVVDFFLDILNDQ
jgi:hypothetical protein